MEKKEFISILNDEETFTSIQGASVAIVKSDAVDQAMRGESLEHCIDQFFLDNPADLRRLAARLELDVLVKKIQDHFEERRSQVRRLSEECGVEYKDPLKDVTIDCRNEVVVLSYNGQGFYDLSDEAWAEHRSRPEIRTAGASEDKEDRAGFENFDPPLRKKIIQSALELGFSAEDIDNSTMILCLKNER